VVVAAGDIACDPDSRSFHGGKGTPDWCHMEKTAELAKGEHPTAVLMLGDAQYESGRLDAFQRSYDKSWGTFKQVVHPVVGNHEYHSDAARAYWEYFGQAAGPAGKGYYAFELGGWHLIALNSNCSHVSCAPGSEQEKGLKSELAAHPHECTLAFWHAPRFSSGLHGDTTAFAAFWHDLYESGADVVLNGHDHDYERFAPQTPGGVRNEERGIREFVVGTGGKNLRGFARSTPFHRNPNSEALQAVTFGVLRLDLYPTGYHWKYVAEDAKAFSDEGWGSCHTAPKAAAATK